VTALQTTDPSSRQRGRRTSIIKQLEDKRKGNIWTWALKEAPTSRQTDLLTVGRINNDNETCLSSSVVGQRATVHLTTIGHSDY
jgi:hypothetical protein